MPKLLKGTPSKTNGLGAAALDSIMMYDMSRDPTGSISIVD